MVIELKEDAKFEVGGDTLIIPKGQHTAISKEYIDKNIDIISPGGSTFSIEKFKDCLYFAQYCVIRFQRHYFIIVKDQYTIPKVVNGWLNY